MARARTQRTLAAAGLSLVTGTAAIGLAIVGVGPLGQVAAGVRDTGAAMSRGVLSVVMPDHDPSPPAETARDSDDSAGSTRRDRPSGQRASVDEQPPDATPPDSASTLPDASAVADQPDTRTLLAPVVDSVPPPSRQASADEAPEGDASVVGAVPHHAGELTSGALR